MAITIEQEPTSPNAAYTHLLYAVSSTQVAQPQFQYVMDILSGGTLLSRVRQYPNPAGNAIFDPSRIMADYMGYLNDTTLAGINPNSNFESEGSIKTFQVNFGEEYGTSPTSAVVLYNGAGSVGAPAVAANPLTLIPATVDPNNGTSFNWPYYNQGIFLTNRPSGVPKADSALMAMAAYNGTATNKTLEATDGLSSHSLTIGPGEVGQVSLPPGSTNEGIFTFNGNTITVPIVADCNYPAVTFAFINDYGFMDFYTVNLPQQKQTRITRETINRPKVDWSSATSAYDVTRRGKDSYYTSVEDDYQVTTDWLSQEEAQWLGQIFESPDVYVRNEDNTDWIPINITNSSYIHNTNKRSQKTFQYEIQYTLSNQRPSR